MRDVWTRVLLGAVVLGAGCVGVGPDGPAPDAASLWAGQTGALHVAVTDDALVPVAGAVVRIDPLGLAATTRADGTAVFGDLPAGPYTVDATAPGFAPGSASVALSAGGVRLVDLRLARLPQAGLRVETLEFEGYFECTLTAFIVTGDCLAAARALPLPPPVHNATNVTNARFAFDFLVPPDWTRIEVTQTWNEGAVSTGDGMRINLESADAPVEAHATRYGRVSGDSPLHLVVERGVPGPDADEGGLVPQEGGALRTRTFHNGIGYDPEGPPFLGAGAATGQTFTVTVIVYAGGPVDAGR